MIPLAVPKTLTTDKSATKPSRRVVNNDFVLALHVVSEALVEVLSYTGREICRAEHESFEGAEAFRKNFVGLVVTPNPKPLTQFGLFKREGPLPLGLWVFAYEFDVSEVSLRQETLLAQIL